MVKVFYTMEISKCDESDMPLHVVSQSVRQQTCSVNGELVVQHFPAYHSFWAFAFSLQISDQTVAKCT
jgi:hypothetical protein